MFLARNIKVNRNLTKVISSQKSSSVINTSFQPIRVKYYATKTSKPTTPDDTSDSSYDYDYDQNYEDIDAEAMAKSPPTSQKNKQPTAPVAEDKDDDIQFGDSDITEEEERALMQKYMTDPRKNADLAAELRSLRLDREKFKASQNEDFVPQKPDKKTQLGFDKRYYPFVPFPRPNHRLINTFIYGDALYSHWAREYMGEIVNLNLLINKHGGLYSDFNLVDLIRCEDSRISTAASTIANHEMFFESLGYSTYHFPQGNIADKFTEQYGGFSKFKRLFNLQALALKKEGWCFLAVDKNFVFHIITTEGEVNPHRFELTPLLALDLHKHAYQNYGDDLTKYINYWWFTLDWDYLSNLIVRHI